MVQMVCAMASWYERRKPLTPVRDARILVPGSDPTTGYVGPSHMRTSVADESIHFD